MKCEEIRSNLLAYLDGEVSEAEHEQVEAHLATCQACTEELARLRALQADLVDAVPSGLAQLQLSREAEARIRSRLRRAAQAQQRGGRSALAALRSLLRPGVGMIKAAIPLVVAVFLVFAGLIGTQPRRVSAQETIVFSPATLAPGTDAALRVVVREYASAQPVTDAEIVVRLRPHGEEEVLLYRGTTGTQGTADVRFQVPEYAADRVSADLIVTTASSLGRDEVVQTVTVQRSFRVYLTSDKPLYQPGQAIYQRVLILDAGEGLPAVGRLVTFAVEGPDGRQLHSATSETSGYGIAALDYELPADAMHGTYRLTARLEDTASERTVTVGRYVRPRFKVDLVSGRSYYLPGDVVEGEVIALSLGGAAMPGATATVRAYLQEPSRQLIATVEGRTDTAGRYVFRFGLPDSLPAEHTHLALEASVRDAAGLVEWAGRVVPVSVEPLSIDVVAEGGRLRPGVENTVYVLTAAPDGAPVRAQLDVGVAGQWFDLATDEYGLTSFRLVPEARVREVHVQVTATQEGEAAVARTVTLSADQGPAQVVLRINRAAYQVGQVMKLEALAGQGEIVYLDVVRGGQTLSTHVLQLSEGRASLDLDVSPEMAGTLQLHAYQILPDGRLVSDARLAVVDALSALDVRLQTDKDAYRPGDTAVVSIDTRLGGQGVQSAVGVAVVDESVFALEERAPGFAKLFFLLEAALLDPDALPFGVDLSDLLEAPEEARAAQDLAARAAWANLPTDELSPQSTHAQAATQAGKEIQRRFKGLGFGLSAALIAIPVALWAAVGIWVRHGVHDGARLWRTSALLVGVILVFILPVLAGILIGLSLLLGDVLGVAFLLLLLVAWLGALVALGVHAWRQRDQMAQIVVLLVAAYGILGGLLGYAAERGGDPPLVLIVGIAAALLGVLVALLVLAAGLWLQRQRVAAGTTVALALLLVALVVLGAAFLSSTSLLARTLADARLYAGPVGWMSACAPATVTEPTGVEVKETVEVEKEVEKEVEVTREVEKVVTKVGEERVTATPRPQATPTVAVARPSATPSPTPPPTATPAPAAQPTSVPTQEPALPPPLLGQYAPETLYWAPELISDEQGHLEIELILPDVPTTWRITALASTRLGDLGAATTTLPAAP